MSTAAARPGLSIAEILLGPLSPRSCSTWTGTSQRLGIDLPSPRTLAEGQFAALLRISRSTLLGLCAMGEHPAVRGADPRGLAAFLVGCHHRITHEALVDWLGRNQQYERESGRAGEGVGASK